MSTTCDVAAYEQGVWYLRLSAMLLLASFTNYVSLPQKRAENTGKPVAQVVEEIQEAVAVPAPTDVEPAFAAAPSSLQRGERLQVPSVPETTAARPTAVQSGRRMRKRRRGVSAGAKRQPEYGISAGTSLREPAPPQATTTTAPPASLTRNVPPKSSSVRKPITISMNPTQVRNLKLSL